MCPVSLKCGDSPPCSGCLVGLKRSPSNTRVVVKLMTSSSTLPSTPLTSCPPMIGLVTRRKPNCKRNQQLPPTPPRRAWCFNVTFILLLFSHLHLTPLSIFLLLEEFLYTSSPSFFSVICVQIIS
uniref:Uncharacterized protein n=1 Tax=Cacopsylla melanoneura TaxID=428564 RepID=A0A8D8SCX0_9HEMI